MILIGETLIQADRILFVSHLPVDLYSLEGKGVTRRDPPVRGAGRIFPSGGGNTNCYDRIEPHALTDHEWRRSGSRNMAAVHGEEVHSLRAEIRRLHGDLVAPYEVILNSLSRLNDNQEMVLL